MRGELWQRGKMSWAIIGSSPHAWGTVNKVELEVHPSRFIPTCVGNCRRRRNIDIALSVHPHMRGELASNSILENRVGGSSPHAWGTGGADRGGFRQRRFIPTCVGNCIQRAPSIAARAVHPHMRGELFSLIRRLRRSGGSSPHAWGTD